ncbi:MAG TPA: hypothetical protein VF132_13510 [Rudaea sp.]
MDGNARIMRRIAQRARREHWPMPYLAALVYQGVAMVLVDAVLIWLVWTQRWSPVCIVTFCVGELLLLMVMARIEWLAVPRDARFNGRHHALLGAEQNSGIFGRLFVCVFMSIWLSVVYAFSLFADPNIMLFVAGAPPLEVLARLNVLWPLRLSAVLALIAMIGNGSIWHRRGGVFVPEMSQPTMPKLLTIFIAPIPATMALFTYIDSDANTALFAWCLTFLGIRCLFDIGMVGLNLLGWYILESPLPAQERAGAAGVQDAEPEWATNRALAVENQG